MHRFFVTTIDNDRVTFSDEQAHQVRQVLRMGAGDRVIAVVDGSGWEYEVELAQVDRKRVTAVIQHKRPITTEPTITLTLYQCLLKRDNFEWVLQKGTEIGVSHFVPLISARTVAHPPRKLTRWQRIVTEAAEQSGRGCIPKIAPPVTWAAVWAKGQVKPVGFMPWAAADSVTITSALASVASATIKTVSVFIGPEGGWTDAEVENGRAAGIIPVTLGKRILRAETAAMVAAAQVMQMLDS
ncbi:MAG: 16S rRNA (uracil(1498)-N(3))-methyltransferase [Chloroflexi bacterium]|nr:MAG: 16S rRNA (uracil(1498)-N(3))-methyltransferase [Chloroflexota bacterium]